MSHRASINPHWSAVVDQYWLALVPDLDSGTRNVTVVPLHDRRFSNFELILLVVRSICGKREKKVLYLCLCVVFVPTWQWRGQFY